MEHVMSSIKWLNYTKMSETNHRYGQWRSQNILKSLSLTDSNKIYIILLFLGKNKKGKNKPIFPVIGMKALLSAVQLLFPLVSSSKYLNVGWHTWMRDIHPWKPSATEAFMPFPNIAQTSATESGKSPFCLLFRFFSHWILQLFPSLHKKEILFPSLISEINSL